MAAIRMAFLLVPALSLSIAQQASAEESSPAGKNYVKWSPGSTFAVKMHFNEDFSFDYSDSNGYEFKGFWGLTDSGTTLYTKNTPYKPPIFFKGFNPVGRSVDQLGNLLDYQK